MFQKATSMGIIDGYEDNSFRPDARITRAEFATIVAKALNLVSLSSKTFPDATNHWGSKAIGALVEQGVLTGYGDGTFKPDKEITRAEIVTVLSRLTDFKPVEKSTFTDIDNNCASTQIKVFAEQDIVNVDFCVFRYRGSILLPEIERIIFDIDIFIVS